MTSQAIDPEVSGVHIASTGASRPGVLQSEEVAAIVQAEIDGKDRALGVLTNAERGELRELYRAGGYRALWLDSEGHPDSNAQDALVLLGAAADDGLDPAEYGVSALDRLGTAVRGSAAPSPRDQATFDATLSAGMLRYVRHLHLGRVDPRALGIRLTVRAERHDFVSLLQTAIASGRIAGLADDLRPPLAQYSALKTMLARYRKIAADVAIQLPPPAQGAVRPGDEYKAAGILVRELVAFGDLEQGTVPADASRYDGVLVDGVKRFQVRHGLEPDGVLGRTTMAALRMPLAWRVRQIELAIERMRWLPDLGDERLIVMNIPMFHLWVWDTIPQDGTPSFGMDVIVGRALRTETPVFVEDMREVIFRPYWNVPRSILLNEILPLIARDPDYFRKQDMEIVRGPGDDAQPVEPTAANIAALRQGTLRLRQRRGPKNALGLVKFVFPNQENVYMHGTPAQELFERSRRDFSHGCVRVEDPVRLAEWVLAAEPDWNRDRILMAMAGASSAHVKLTRPIQVILFYTTAVVMPEDGTIRFSEDIYRRDVTLDRALVARRPAR